MKTYMRLRADGHNARSALHHARIIERAAMLDALLPIDEPSYPGDAVAVTALPCGGRLEIEYWPDYDGCSRDDATLEWHRLESHAHCSDGWLARDGETVYGTSRRGDAYTAQMDESVSSLARYYRKSGMARGPAWLAAVRSMQARADYLRQCVNGSVEAWGFTVTLYSADGREIESESLGGIEGEADEAIVQARVMLADYAKKSAEAREAYRVSIREARKEYRDIAAEVRQLRGIHAPHACAALRESLAMTAARVRTLAASCAALRLVAFSYRNMHPNPERAA